MRCSLTCLAVTLFVSWAPWSSPAAAQSTAPSLWEPDLVYGHKDGLALTMDLHRPEGPANGAAVLFMVSGGWYSRWAPPDQMRPLFQPYLDAGFTLFAVRHGSSPRYSIPEAVSDVRQAVRFVRSQSARLGIDGDRLGVLGMSAGGHLGLMLGTTGEDGQPQASDALSRHSSRVQAVVAFVPPTDLTVAVWESPESLPAYRNFPALDLPLTEAAKFSPRLQVTSDDAPSLVIMGERDELVPPRHGSWIEEAFTTQKVPHKLIILPEAGHDLGNDASRATATEEAVNWFRRHLLDEGPK